MKTAYKEADRVIALAIKMHQVFTEESFSLDDRFKDHLKIAIVAGLLDYKRQKK